MYKDCFKRGWAIIPPPNPSPLMLSQKPKFVVFFEAFPYLITCLLDCLLPFLLPCLLPCFLCHLLTCILGCLLSYFLSCLVAYLRACHIVIACFLSLIPCLFACILACLLAFLRPHYYSGRVLDLQD